MNKRFIKSAVIGHPVKHSKSPLIHRHWMKAYDLDGSYETIDIAPESLEKDVQGLIEQGYAGFNVTIPHKITIMDLCANIDETARRIGAVNTVIIGEDGILSGSNTDSFGFIQNIKKNVPNFSFLDGTAVVLGAGGAARAIVYGLLQEGVPKIILMNRTRAKAQELADSMKDSVKIAVVDWDDRHDALDGANLLVNATSLGMEGKVALDLNLDALPKYALVNDIVYVPLLTDLLVSAKARGNDIVSGIGMLLHQARPGFELWHGTAPEVTKELESLVLK